MPELLAGEVAWLGGGLLFAWLAGALTQMAAAAPAWASRPTGRPGPRCRRGGGALRVVGGWRRVLLFALLPAALASVLAACAPHPFHAVAATEAGVLCGAWLASRQDFTRRVRAVSLAGCVAGATLLGVGFSHHPLAPGADCLQRGVLYVAILLGALIFAASASAWYVAAVGGGFAATTRRGGPASLRPARSAFGDRFACSLALMLCAALAYGFVTADARATFGLPALIAASVLAAAFGMRMMIGPHLVAPVRASVVHAGIPRVRELARPSFAGIPDELLVAACRGESFEAACLAYPFTDEAGVTRHVAHRALSHRRRVRYGAARGNNRRRVAAGRA